MSSPNPIANQYSSFPYPEPGDDIPTWLTSFNYDGYDPAKFAVKFWPEGRPKTDLNILVAGCGSMQAAVIAFNNPECRVTGIDFSDGSIAHEERLRERHELANLTLRTMELLGVSRLQQQFDLIICTGVLHHLPNPAEGLKALSSVIEPSHGVMVLMLYGKLGRIGIYPLQDAFRRMRIPQTAEGVALVRSIINRLQPRHPGRWYFERSSEMRSPATIIYTFLHRQDVAYTVQELLDLVEGSELKFQGWLDSAPYNIGFPDQDLESLCKDFPDRDRWSIVEDLTMLRLATHNFLACRGQNATRTARSTSAESNGYRIFPLDTLQGAFRGGPKENSRAKITSSNCRLPKQSCLSRRTADKPHPRFYNTEGSLRWRGASVSRSLAPSMSGCGGT